MDGKGKVGRVAVSEQGDDLARKSLEQDKSDAGDDEIVQDRQLVGLFYTVILPGSVVEADDGLGSLGNSDDDRQQDRVGFHDDTAGGQGNVGAVGGLGAVVGQGVVHDDLYQRDGHLVEAVAHAKAGSLHAFPGTQAQAGTLQPDALEPADIGDGRQEGKKLSDDGGPCGPRYAHVKGKDEQRVQNGVDDGADQRTGHGVFGAAVRQNQFAHAGGNDLEGHAQGNDPGVGGGVGHDCGRRAEGRQKGCEKQLHQNGVDHAEDHHHADAVSGDLCRVFLPSRSQIEGKAGGASDADEQGDGQTDGGQGIGDVGGGVAQITDALSDENLVYDIIERSHQHGDDAGDRETF